MKISVYVLHFTNCQDILSILQHRYHLPNHVTFYDYAHTHSYGLLVTMATSFRDHCLLTINYGWINHACDIT